MSSASSNNPMSTFPAGFAQGLSVRGMPLVQSQTGNVWWVSNNANVPVGVQVGQDSVTTTATPGKGTYNRPFATIARALLQCVAGAGDIIMVKAGHVETIANATTLLLNVAGVAIVGLGTGSLRPTLNFTTANTANIPVTAANMSIQNFLFTAGFLSIASVFTATGTSTPTDFDIEFCEFRDSSAVLTFLAQMTGNATANSCDGFRFVKNKVFSLASGSVAVAAFKPGSATARHTMTDNVLFSGSAATGPAGIVGSTFAMTNLDCGRNLVYRPSTQQVGTLMTGTGASTGLLYDNYAWTLATSAGLLITTGTGLGFVQNYCTITGTADKNAVINPATA